jgi:iron(III) transport system substrate-binding protein
VEQKMVMTFDRRAFMGLAGGAAGLLAMPHVARAQEKVVNLYSARHYNTDEALYSEFTKLTGIVVKRVDAEPDPLIERMKAEGANSPADVFLSVDAGRIEAARGFGLLQPIKSAVIEGAVPANLRDPDGHWFGFSTRARVIMYNKDKVKPGDIARYEDLADPKWKGRVLTRSSTNVYSQSLTGSVLAANGADKTEAWCKGVVANLARAPKGGDTDQIRAMAAGEGDVALANTYYLGKIIRQNKPEDAALIAKVGVLFPNQADRGAHVNISGGGLTASAKNKENAIKFLEYLVSASAQAYFAAGNDEYPVVAGIAPPSSIMGLGAFKADQINAGVFARNNAEGLKIMDRAGWK